MIFWIWNLKKKGARNVFFFVNKRKEKKIDFFFVFFFARFFMLQWRWCGFVHIFFSCSHLKLESNKLLWMNEKQLVVAPNLIFMPFCSSFNFFAFNIMYFTNIHTTWHAANKITFYFECVYLYEMLLLSKCVACRQCSCEFMHISKI